VGYVYKISNIIDNRVYIGSTINLHKRWNEHKRDLLKNKHQNIHLQRFVNKYGLDKLNFSVIETVIDDNILLNREQYYMNITENKFNIAENSSAPMLGKTHTMSAIKKISSHSSGKSNPMFGKKRPEWLINKLTACSLNRLKTNEEKIKRIINLPNRIEIIIEKDNTKINCFSLSHAASIVTVSQQSISKAIKNNSWSRGWRIKKSEEIFYKKEILLKNLHLFDENYYPQPELTQMLKSLS